MSSSIEKGDFYLQEAAKRGYFLARSQLFRTKAKRWGVLGELGAFFFSAYMKLQMIWVILMNSNDPRVYTD